MDIELTEEERIRVLNSEDLYLVMQRILLRENKIDQDREHLWMVGLSHTNKILFIELAGLGTVNAVIVEPMEVFSFALQKRAVRVMLVHNHPSGDLRPSKEDKDLTDRMIQVGLIVKTPLLDHLIISTTNYISFAEIGLMNELLDSTKYVPPYQLKERLEKQSEELRKKARTVEEQESKLKQKDGTIQELKQENAAKDKVLLTNQAKLEKGIQALHAQGQSVASIMALLDLTEAEVQAALS